MSELTDLYQELILDHNARPRNFGELPEATHVGRGHNPLCGDEMTLQLRIDAHGKVAAARFSGQGCAISRASASLMTEHLIGRPAAALPARIDQFRQLLTVGEGGVDLAAMGKLAALAGVRDFPMRVKCATLAWHTLGAALAGEGGPANTEAEP